MPLWLLVDASNMVYRDVFAAGGYAIRNIQRRMDAARLEFEPERIVFAMDPAGKSFRHSIESTYKANRKDDRPPEIGITFDKLRGYAIENADEVVQVDGFEADDIIATLARIAQEGGRRACVVSSDKDVRQCLVDGRVSQSVKMPVRVRDSEYMTAATLFYETGIRPDQWAEYQAVVGDKADGYGGCEGIGPRFARMIFEQFDTLDDYFKNPLAVKIPKSRQQELFRFRRGPLAKSKQLATLRTDVPLPASWLEFAA
ncbi:MAG: 5'-3' exonuclease H3TH domain-containing protein [Planctomycetota bacterium]